MLKAATIALCMGCAAPSGPTLVAQDNDAVDVALVLAVDGSRSMDRGEFQLQRKGYADALRHPDFLSAVRSGMHRRIALAYFEWAGAGQPQSVVDWAIIDSEASAAAFAARIEERPDSGSRYGTSISGAIDHAAGMFAASPASAPRQVLDVSGDGPNNMGGPVTEARDRALAKGLVINGLPVMISPKRAFRELDRYYADCVTGGPGSFVMPVYDVAEFATAIRRKLVLEISGLEPQPRLVPVAAQPPVDCTATQRDRRFQRGINVPTDG